MDTVYGLVSEMYDAQMARDADKAHDVLLRAFKLAIENAPGYQYPDLQEIAARYEAAVAVGEPVKYTALIHYPNSMQVMLSARPAKSMEHARRNVKAWIKRDCAKYNVDPEQVTYHVQQVG